MKAGDARRRINVHSADALLTHCSSNPADPLAKRPMSDDPNVDQPCQLWGLLSGDIHSIIVEFLWRQNDQASVNAVMQTSRDF